MEEYELSRQEKGIILGIILNTRNDYLKKYKYSKIKYESLENIETINTNERIEDVVLKNYDEFLRSSELSNLFENPNIKKVIEKALTEKQKSVLFLYYCKNRKDKEIASILNIKEDTSRKIRNRSLEKIRKKIKE